MDRTRRTQGRWEGSRLARRPLGISEQGLEAAKSRRTARSRMGLLHYEFYSNRARAPGYRQAFEPRRAPIAFDEAIHVSYLRLDLRRSRGSARRGYSAGNEVGRSAAELVVSRMRR